MTETCSFGQPDQCWFLEFQKNGTLNFILEGMNK